MALHGGVAMRCWCLLVLVAGMWGQLAWGFEERALDDARIFSTLVPMPALDAKRLVHRMGRAGLAKKWHAPLDEYLRTNQIGNSQPLELPTRSGHLCIAMALRSDVDAVLGLAPEQDTATRHAVAAFLLTHEAVHCASMVLPAPAANRHPSTREESELEGLALLREESLADQIAHQSLLKWGRVGYHASVAWQRYRLWGLLRGDLDHWTTPLVQDGLDSVSEGDYQAFVLAWPDMIRALNRHEDGSESQARAWQAAVDRIPPSLRTGLPSLEHIRALALQRWPQAGDWRCAAGVKRDAKTAPPPRCPVQ